MILFFSPLPSLSMGHYNILSSKDNSSSSNSYFLPFCYGMCHTNQIGLFLDDAIFHQDSPSHSWPWSIPPDSWLNQPSSLLWNQSMRKKSSSCKTWSAPPEVIPPGQICLLSHLLSSQQVWDVPSHISQFTCQAKADPFVLRHDTADDPWSTTLRLRKPLSRTHQEQDSPIVPEGLYPAPHRTLPLQPGHRVQASRGDHRAQEDRAEGSICSLCR